MGRSPNPSFVWNDARFVVRSLVTFLRRSSWLPRVLLAVVLLGGAGWVEPSWGQTDAGPFQPWGDPPSGTEPRESLPFGSIPDASFVGPTWNAPTESFGHEVPWLRIPWLEPGREETVGRHQGLGEPLVGTSWLNRPWHVGWMFGSLLGDELARGEYGQGASIVGGYRVGRDLDHYWSTEARFTFSNPDLDDANDASWLTTAKNHYFDVHLLYYPWGDSRWRPYASLGVGWGNFQYTPADGNRVDKALFEIPVGGGVKYYFRNWMALRLSATDHWMIGQGPMSTMHNFALTADVEMHFGGRRTSYSLARSF